MKSVGGADRLFISSLLMSSALISLVAVLHKRNKMHVLDYILCFFSVSHHTCSSLHAVNTCSMILLLFVYSGRLTACLFVRCFFFFSTNLKCALLECLCWIFSSSERAVWWVTADSVRSLILITRSKGLEGKNLMFLEVSVSDWFFFFSLSYWGDFVISWVGALIC